jgi:uncharacterized protein (TIGR04222 family)
VDVAATAWNDLAEDHAQDRFMPLNPLDWTAQPFLTLYVAIAGVAVLLVLALRRSAGTGPDEPAPAISDPVMLAWLAGGPRRAADTVLVAFLESGAADQAGRRGRLTIDLKRGSLPAWFLRFAVLANSAQSVTAFRRAIKPALEDVRDTLVQRGLAPSRDAITRLPWYSWVIFTIPLILGSLKLVVGLERGRPVGILFFLLLFTAAIALIMTGSPPLRTRAGRAAAAEALQLRARAARAPEDNEVVLAFALSGAAVLAGRPYASLLVPGGGSGGGDASGCGGGGDGGGGCG